MQKINVATTYCAGLLGLTLGCLAMTGCGVLLDGAKTTPSTVAGSALQGSVHGGQQPVAGATIQMYAAGTSGYGSAATAVLPGGITTDATGGFSITGTYTCPSASSQMYLVATGGNPGVASNNASLILMAALGACGNLSASTFINMNELTTVASVWALAPFMSSVTKVGTSATNVQGLVNAFATVNTLVNTAIGTAPGTTATGVTVPSSELNALADILAACVNTTGGVAGDASACGTLFTAATPVSGTAPTDTVTAALDIAKNPSHNVSTLIGLIVPSSPFQPALASATDFTVSVKYANVALNNPVTAVVDPSGNLWVANAGNNTVSEIGPSGASVGGSPYSGSGLNVPSALAIDATGNAWIANKGASTMTVITSAGVGSQPAVAGLSTPTSVSIDGQGTVWVANSGNNSVTAITTSGTSATASNSFTVGGISAPVAVAINPQ